MSKSLDEQIADYHAQKERARVRQHRAAAPLPFNAKLQSRLDAYAHGDGKVAFPGEYRKQCRTCGDTGIVYVKRDYVVNGRKMGEWEVQEPCPKCAPPRCLVCMDSGVVSYALPVGHPDFGRIFFCECGIGRAQAIEAQARALRNAQLPAHFQSLTFATWDSLPAQQRQYKDMARMAVELWVMMEAQDHAFAMADVYHALGYDPATAESTPRNSIVLSGPVGTGKTGLVAAAINALALGSHRPLYTRVQDLLTSLKALMNNDKGETPDMLLDKVKRAPTLVLDEFTTNQTTDWRRDQIEELIRFRYGNNLPTLVTTNSTRETVEVEWGLRTATALFAMAHWVELSGVAIRDEGRVYVG